MAHQGPSTSAQAAQEEGVSRLAAKLQNDGRIRNAESGDVLLNAYRMILDKAVEKVYQYQLKFVGIRKKQRMDGDVEEIRIELSKGLKGGTDVTKQIRLEMHKQLFRQLIDVHQDIFSVNGQQTRRHLVYDCSMMLFSVYKLPGVRNESARHLPFDVDRNRLSEEIRANIRTLERIEAQILWTGELKLRTHSEELVQFLEILTSQMIHERDAHLVLGQKAYERNSSIPVQNDPRILKKGMQKNVRFVGESMKDAMAIVQIDPKKSPFDPNLDLLEFLQRLFNCRSPRDLEDRIWRDQRGLREANKQLKGLTVQTTHMPDAQRLITLSGLTETPIKNQIFTSANGQQISVVDYFRERYAREIRHRNLPCVIHRKQIGNPPQMKEDYLPIEVLKIYIGQRVSLEKQGPALTQEMIRLCQVLPGQLAQEIEENRNMAVLQNQNPYLRAHGVQMEANGLMKVKAERLHPSAIQYRDARDRVEPDSRGRLDWRMSGQNVPRDRQYVFPATFPRRWVVVNVQNSMSKNDLERFCQSLIRCAQTRGLTDAQITHYDYEFFQTDQEYVKEKFKNYKARGYAFTLFFAPGKEESRKRNAFQADIHHQIKAMEPEYGILTQHISPATTRRPTGIQMVLDNIMMKMNQKLGGVNYTLHTPRAMSAANSSIKHDIIAKEWLGLHRMFIGIDLSHAPPQSRFERGKGKATVIPTVVGFCYTMGVGEAQFGLRGSWWYQRPRVATVHESSQLAKNVETAMQNHYDRNGQFPSHLIVFRGGVSEGEFEQIAEHEGNAITEAFKELGRKGVLRKKPLLTMIACQRQSNYRAIPSRIQGRNAREQNIQPGTVIDREVLHPNLTEFLINAHEALQGTSRPVRCTVIVDSANPRVPVQELEYIYYALCHAHGITTKATALPAPLHSAGDLAKRGRNNWRTLTDDGRRQVGEFNIEVPMDMPEEEAMDEAERQQMVQTSDSKEFKPTIFTHYWA